MTTYAIDFETWCELDLSVVGSAAYIEHESFTPTLVALSGRSTTGSVTTKVLDLLPSCPDLEANLDELRIFTNEIGVYQEHTDEDLMFNGASKCLAHNSEFEAQIIRKLFGAQVPLLDTAVLARMAGLSGGLDAAAEQLLQEGKLKGHRELKKKFALCPTVPEWEDVKSDPDWDKYRAYAARDAELLFSLEEGVYEILVYDLSYRNKRQQALTDLMNRRGWFVDLEEVELMSLRAQLNTKQAQEEFFTKYFQPDEPRINLNSLPQMKKWCASKGVRVDSFAADQIVKTIKRINKARPNPDPNTQAVLDLLHLKQALGGSSLSKLEVIKRMISKDGRLRNQYLHSGAGQTRRTTGTGVQMQNLKRLGSHINMEDLSDLRITFTNEELADNIRQLFQAEAPEGMLIVGDFSSIESRGLAFLAGADWKLQAYREGKDAYKVNAVKFYGVRYEDVTPEQRKFGKVGELSCGYNAGSAAVQSFAEGMGVNLTTTEAAEIVTQWRDANPEIVKLWKQLDDSLHECLRTGISALRLPHAHLEISFTAVPSPASLQAIRPGAKDICIQVMNSLPRVPDFTRIFRGAYFKGSQIVYHKPSSAVNSAPWSDTFMDPKTKQRRNYTIYGGKLTGILTQSFCREIFFSVLEKVETHFSRYANTKVIGQFHDEIVVEWSPPSMSNKGQDTAPEILYQLAVMDLKKLMSPISGFGELPIAADVHGAHRYIK